MTHTCAYAAVVLTALCSASHSPVQTEMPSRVNPPGRFAQGAPTKAETPPNPTSVEPPQGMTIGGIDMYVLGEGFTTLGTTRVTFGGVDATDVHVYDPGYGNPYIVCVLPPHAQGVVDIVVVNPDGLSGSLLNGFTYLLPPPPYPTSVNPTGGSTAGGTVVRIDGEDFYMSGTTRVLFDGADATQVEVKDTDGLYVSCVTPAHAAGLVDVVVINPDGQSTELSEAYTYAPPPAPLYIRPASGPTAGGTTVVIAGTGFQENGITTVTFDGVESGIIGIAGSTHVGCVSPPHDAGAVDVRITNPDGQTATLGGAFVYTDVPYPSHVAFVDGKNVIPYEDGTSWERAFHTIQDGVDAIVASGQPGEVWVAEGTYSSTSDAVVVMASSCDIYGGFATTERVRDERRVAGCVTIIDGQDAHACVYGADGARLDGFTVTRGNGPLKSGTSSTWWGYVEGIFGAVGQPVPDPDSVVAIDNLGVSPTIANCIMEDNQSQLSVVANLSDNGHSSNPVFTGCTFQNNTGEVICVSNGSLPGLPCEAVFDQCAFLANGAAMMLVAIDSSCSPSITHTVFDANGDAILCETALGGEVNIHGENSVFTNQLDDVCTFFPFLGDAHMTAEFSCCTFADNANLHGVFCQGSSSSVPSSVSLKNCIVWGNSGPLSGGSAAPQVTVEYSDIRGGYAGTGNVNADPLFAAGSYKIRGNSPCADTGTALGAPSDDVRGISRPQFGGIDMGAYECTVRANYDTLPPDSIAAHSAMQFRDKSVTTASPLHSWHWSFGDMEVSDLRDPFHVYATPGTYTVVLDVASADDAATFINTLQVLESTPLSILVHPESGTGHLGYPYSLSIATQGGSGTIHYHWKKGLETAPYDADAAIYEIPSVSDEDAGIYVCEVADDVDMLTSEAAELMVAPAGMSVENRGVAGLMFAFLLAAGTGYLRRSVRCGTEV